MTELLLNGVFNNLTPQQAASLLSCMVFQENASELPKLTDELSGPLRIMQVRSTIRIFLRIAMYSQI